MLIILANVVALGELVWGSGKNIFIMEVGIK